MQSGKICIEVNSEKFETCAIEFEDEGKQNSIFSKEDLLDDQSIIHKRPNSELDEPQAFVDYGPKDERQRASEM